MGIPAQAAKAEKLVALTFDDGPSGRFTQRLLDGLAERNVKATFLLCGYRMIQSPSLTKRIYQEGHEIGIHGYSHKAMENMSRNEIRLEIQKTIDMLPEGCEATFFRAPGGAGTKEVCAAAKDLGLAVLQWSVDPKDWATGNASAVESAVITRVQHGDVILMHDMSDSSVDAALRIIDNLQSQGFRFVTAGELAAAAGIQPQPGKEYFRFRSHNAK